MKKITLKRFIQLCYEEDYRYYIVASDNQPRESPLKNGVFKFDMVFERINASLNPDIIKFSCAQSSLQVNNIEYIFVDKIKSFLGTVFEICCATHKNEPNKSLVVIARK